MADNTRRNWYIAFGAILTTIGTFLVTTDPIFHYANMFSSKVEIDTTKVVSHISRDLLDSLTTPDPEIWTLPRISKEVKHLKNENIKHDSLIHKVILGDQ